MGGAVRAAAAACRGRTSARDTEGSGITCMSSRECNPMSCPAGQRSGGVRHYLYELSRVLSGDVRWADIADDGQS